MGRLLERLVLRFKRRFESVEEGVAPEGMVSPEVPLRKTASDTRPDPDSSHPYKPSCGGEEVQ